jgi:hypothetical protein
MNAPKTLLALGSAMFLSTAALAQPFAIDWHVIGNCGGTSTGGAFTLNWSLGQAEANPQPMTGGIFSLTGGFWSPLTIQAPDAPLLSIQWQGAEVRLFWPRSAAAFLLEHSPVADSTWSLVNRPYATNAVHISVSAPLPVANTFYRLRRP